MPSNNPLNRAGVVKAATISAGKYIGATAGRIGEAILGTTRAKQSIVYQQLSHQNAMKRLETYHNLALDRINAEKDRQSDILNAKTKAGEESSRRRGEQAAKNAAAREQAARNKPKAQGPTADIIALRKADVAGDGHQDAADDLGGVPDRGSRRVGEDEAGEEDRCLQQRLRMRVVGAITPVVQAAAKFELLDFVSREPSLEETFLAQYGRGTEAPADVR